MRIVHSGLDLTHFERLGHSLGAILLPGDALLLEGPLGAGKTTLVRAVAEGMGINPSVVSSPTFVVINQYPSPDGRELVHVDAYRLTGPGDLESLGWDRITHPGLPRILAIEWPERLGEAALPAWAGPPARITIHAATEETRDLTLDAPDSWQSRAGFDSLRPRRATVCRITGRSVPADAPTWPFADERARMADLYRWMSGSYAIEAEMGAPDEPGDPA
jgi:tRNA threonylcarbamoyladenosine biosynthesis protein TsaE